MKKIDIRLTWKACAPILIAALQDGNAIGKKSAKIELHKMATVADKAVDMQDLLPALKGLTDYFGKIKLDKLPGFNKEIAGRFDAALKAIEKAEGRK